MLRELAKLDEIQTITPGSLRHGRGRSEKLQIRITTKTIAGYKLIARRGRLSQEVFVVTKKSKELLTKDIIDLIGK